MKHLEHKSMFAARLLLSVFIPMLVCLSLHIHQTVDASAGECYECNHHLPHQGHFSAAKAALHDCLLCQLSHVPFVVPQTASFISVQNLHYALCIYLYQPLTAVVQGLFLPRAPPA